MNLIVYLLTPVNTSRPVAAVASVVCGTCVARDAALVVGSLAPQVNATSVTTLLTAIALQAALFAFVRQIALVLQALPDIRHAIDTAIAPVPLWLSSSVLVPATLCAMVATAPLRLVLGTPLSGRRSSSVALQGQAAALHKRVSGTSGSGKSKFLATLILQLLNQGVGVFLIDPHGDLCDDVLRALWDTGFYIDERAYRRVWYVDFSRTDAFLPFNVLAAPYEPHTTSRLLLEAWKRAWSVLASGNAANLENIVLAGSYVLIENRLPLTALSRMLTDRPFRDTLLERVADEQVIAFFHARFDALGRRADVLVESTLRRAFLLSFTPALRYSLGQRSNRLQFRHLMDQGISVLANVSGLDPDTQRFLGCLLTVGTEEAALSRADLPEHARRPYHLVIDEFSQFAAQSEQALERVLALTRKYGLSLTLAHQTTSQVSRHLEGALQNALTIAFRAGREDAGVLASRLFVPDPYRVKHVVSDWSQQARSHPVFMSAAEQRSEFEQQLTSLAPREAIIRMGDETVRFRSVGLPESRCTREQLETLKDRYARRLLVPRARIEAEQRDLLDEADEPDGPYMPGGSDQMASRPTGRGVCDSSGPEEQHGTSGKRTPAVSRSDQCQVHPQQQQPRLSGSLRQTTLRRRIELEVGPTQGTQRTQRGADADHDRGATSSSQRGAARHLDTIDDPDDRDDWSAGPDPTLDDADAGAEGDSRGLAESTYGDDAV